MRVPFHTLAAAGALALVVAIAVPADAQQATAKLRAPDVIFVPTPQEVVDAMLSWRTSRRRYVCTTSGSGDGRIPITAAQKYGIARGVGIDINPERIKEANENLARPGRRQGEVPQPGPLRDRSQRGDGDHALPAAVAQRETDAHAEEAQAGDAHRVTRFDMGSEWPPEKTQDVNGRTIYYWTIK